MVDPDVTGLTDDVSGGRASIVALRSFLHFFFFFFKAEDGIRDADVTGVQTCALPIFNARFCNSD